MGLGSNSEPVPVSIMGQGTHLADSMQLALEYFFRIEDGPTGVYYTGCSFRGEDLDAMHLNQFYHIECELQGGFSDGISVAERYIVNLVTGILQDHADTVREIAGSVTHLEALLELYRSHGGRFKQITLDEALTLLEMDCKTWKYVIPSDPDKGRTITRAGERELIKAFDGAVWLTEMDHLSVPFYQAYADDGGKKAKCADLLLGEGEVLDLGERYVLTEEVLRALNQHEVPADPYTWYMEIRNMKALQTTGWGLGVERFLAWVLQHDDIRDISIIHRLKESRFAP